MNVIREPSVAGMFYPADEENLKTEVDLLLSITDTENKFNNAVGLISPHAGYMYSGKTAAVGFNAVSEKKIDTVIIISPSHNEYFAGVSIYNGDAYRTPLGAVEINKSISEKLSEEGKFIFEGIEGHRKEHAIEVQIPFLQRIFENFSIVPVVMGDQRDVFVDKLADKLAEVIDDKTLIVASSDMSHFYPKEKASHLDSIVEEHIKKFDYAGLQKDLNNRICEACGGGPIVAMMKAADKAGKTRSKILARSDSGDVTGDDSSVVGYLSAVVY